MAFLKHLLYVAVIIGVIGASARLADCQRSLELFFTYIFGFICQKTFSLSDTTSYLLGAVTISGIALLLVLRFKGPKKSKRGNLGRIFLYGAIFTIVLITAGINASTKKTASIMCRVDTLSTVEPLFNKNTCQSTFLSTFTSFQRFFTILITKIFSNESKMFFGSHFIPEIVWNFNKQSQKTLNEDIYSTYKKLFELNPESYFDYFGTIMGFEDEKQINIGRASVYIISGLIVSLLPPLYGTILSSIVISFMLTGNMLVTIIAAIAFATFGCFLARFYLLISVGSFACNFNGSPLLVSIISLVSIIATETYLYAKRVGAIQPFGSSPMELIKKYGYNNGNSRSVTVGLLLTCFGLCELFPKFAQIFFILTFGL